MALNDDPRLDLAEHWLAYSENGLTQAGLDITSGYAVDSFLGLRPRDPWDEECIRRFVDVLIQHESVVYPAPSRRSLEPGALALEDPYVFASARQRSGLLQPYSKTAEEIQLPQEDVQELWTTFERWALEPENDRRIREWLSVHHDPSIERFTDQIRYIDQFWPQPRSERVLQFLQIPEAELRYIFDIFVRTVRYQLVLGEETVFFPHPVRLAARVRGARSFDGMTWSWGGFLAAVMSDPARRDVTWLLDQIEAIKGAAQTIVKGANWYALGQRPATEQHDVIVSVAAEARLPAYLQTQVQFQAALFAGGVAAAAAYLGTDVSVVVSLLSLLGGTQVSRKVPSGVARWKVLRGYLHWPGLIHSRTK